MHFCTEAEFLNVIGTNVLRDSSLLLTVTYTNRFLPPPPRKSGLKLVCNVNTVLNSASGGWPAGVWTAESAGDNKQAGGRHGAGENSWYMLTWFKQLETCNLSCHPVYRNKNNLFVLTAISQNKIIINYSDDFIYFPKKIRRASRCWGASPYILLSVGLTFSQGMK